MVKVSVIVPVYNVEKYLDKCLDSLVNQTLKEIEIIVVNDGTKDNSQKIIDKYVKKYPKKIKSHIKENGGQSSARNYGLQYATGEYIGFVDSDDWVDFTMYEKMYSKCLSENLDIVVCDVINVYENGFHKYMTSNFNYSDDIVKNYIISPPMACTRIYKKFLFDDEKFKEGILYEDLNITPGLALKTKKIGFINEGLYFYLQRSGSIMNQKNFNKKLLDIFDVLDNNYKKLNKEYFNEIEYLYITHLLRTTSLRFIDYCDSKEYLNKINEIIKERFPSWQKNDYYKKSSNKLQIICKLAYKKMYFCLKVMKKIAKQ